MQYAQVARRALSDTETADDLIREAQRARLVSSRPRGADISIRDLHKSYDGKTVLKGLNLEIKSGEFVAIVGRSGCGKSTLLRLLAGLETADSGTITFGDGDASAKHSLRVMFQEPRLLPWARVLSNVEVGLGRNRRE